MNASAVEAKLDGVEFDSFVLEGAPLSQAVDLVREKLAAGGDELRIGYERVRVVEVEKLISLELEKVKLGEVLEAIGDAAVRVVDVHHDGVTLRRSLGPSEPFLKAGETMEVREFKVTHWLYEMLCWRTKGVGVSDDPFAAADSAAEVEFVSLQQLFEQNGVGFGEGAGITYSSAREVLTVRNTVEELELVEVFLMSGQNGFPTLVRVQTEVYSVSVELASKLADAAGAAPGGVAAMHLVGHAIEVGEASLVAAPGLVTRSGQRAKVTSGKQLRVPKGWQEKDGAKTMLFEKLDGGTSMEVDPVVGADRETIELNLAIEVATGEPSFREISSVSEAGEVVRLSVPELEKATLLSATTCSDGQALYLGALGGAEDGQVLIAFVTATLATAHREMVVPE